jgi:class 3 adenylate cyclase
MFTDLVGSTALSTKLDPEDMRFVIGAYHKCVAETVARFDGFVAKYMGDGALIYFGYPHAARRPPAKMGYTAGCFVLHGGSCRQSIAQTPDNHRRGPSGSFARFQVGYGIVDLRV